MFNGESGSVCGDRLLTSPLSHTHRRSQHPINAEKWMGEYPDLEGRSWSSKSGGGALPLPRGAALRGARACSDDRPPASTVLIG
jgi:hypothetical protein